MNADDEKLDPEEMRNRISELVTEIRTSELDRRRTAVEEIYDLSYKAPDLAKSAVPILIDCLSESDENIGEKAHYALANCSPESIEPLIECLAHPDAKVRERASHSLGTIGEDAAPACDALRGLLSDAVEDVRRRAAWALGLIHDTSLRTISMLFEMVQSPSASERSSALHALGNIGTALVDTEPLQAKRSQILAALRDEDEDVRWSAAYVVESLGLEPSEHAQLIVQQLSRDKSSRVRESIVRHLKKLVPETDLRRYLPSLCEIVAAGGTEAREMCEVLAAMGDKAKAAVPSLVEALRDESLAIAAARALWKIDRRIKESLPALEKAFDSNPESICDLICEIGPAAAPLMPKVIEALRNRDYWDLAWAAADALGHLYSDDPAVLAVLADALGHPSPIVRSAAARALAQTGAPALSVLRPIVENETDPRAEWAADALGQMGHSALPAADTLRRHLRSRKRALATWSTIALAKVAGDAGLVPALVELLRNERADLRKEAALGLKAIGPAARTAVPALELAAEDEDEEVREAIGAALSAIKSPRH